VTAAEAAAAAPAAQASGVVASFRLWPCSPREREDGLSTSSLCWPMLLVLPVSPMLLVVVLLLPVSFCSLLFDAAGVAVSPLLPAAACAAVSPLRSR
jgi:hypothetical protein